MRYSPTEHIMGVIREAMYVGLREHVGTHL